MGHDGDSFNRWEAGQAAATRHLMLAMIAGQAPPIPIAIYVDAIGEVLATRRRRSGLRRADADAAARKRDRAWQDAGDRSGRDPHRARDADPRHRRCAWRPSRRALRKPGDTRRPYSPDATSAGRRALRNAALRYLTAADDEDAAELAEAHYRAATNMTDMIAGLAALAAHEFAPARRRLRPFPRPLPQRSAGARQMVALQAGSPLPGTVAACAR